MKIVATLLRTIALMAVVTVGMVSIIGKNGPVTPTNVDPCAVKVGWLNRPVAAAPLVWGPPTKKDNFSWTWASTARVVGQTSGQ